MTNRDRPPQSLLIVESVYALLILAWFALPALLRGSGILDPAGLVAAYFPAGSKPSFGSVLLSITVWILPLLALWKLAANFLASSLPVFADPRRSFSIVLSFVQTAIPMALFLAHAITFAKGVDYFTRMSFFTLLVILCSIAANGFSIVNFVSFLRRRDPSWGEWEGYKESGAVPIGVLAKLTQQSIQKTLLVSFVPLIVVIILVLSLILMRDFSATILNSVIESGKSLADRTSNVIKANPADKIGAEDYLLLEAKKNSDSAFPFDSMSYYIRNPKTGALSVAATTDKALEGAAAVDKLDAFVDPYYRYDASKEIYEFLAPVTLSKTFLGYVKIDYERSVIFEAYNRTVIKVIAISGLFIYGAFFLIYAMGNGIVFPILLLRMSVSHIAATLQSMLRGQSKVSAALLTFTDRVRTRDEIKELSAEIGNMTGVIRGIVPYISAETFKHSESDKPTSEKQNLCFLFTDIRGFTTMSEKYSPEKVVEVLNHYLDIQATVIEANDGDIDKYVGDEVMAMFGGPDKEKHACAAALGIRAAMAAEKELAIAAKENIVSIGIGINSGDVVHGSVGAKNRMDFTSIGDTVNLAARLEGQNKTYGTKTLVTKVVYDAVKEIYLCREIDLIAVKGKSEAARIYEIIQTREKASKNLQDLCASFEEALGLYRSRKWDKAEKVFAGLVATMRDEASETFLERIRLARLDPPAEDWDGVFMATSK